MDHTGQADQNKHNQLMISVGRNPKTLMSCPDLIYAFACPRVVNLTVLGNKIF